MSELYPVDEVLGRIKGFTPIRRVLLATAGTLQSTLAAYFGMPVLVRVVKQEDKVPPEEGHTGRVLHREVEMYTVSVDERVTVCLASSRIVVSNEELVDRILEEKLGLGQILQWHGVKPKFVLHDVGNSKSQFWRQYSLMAPDIVYDIKETFPRNLYR